jgi:hypothetical protein
MGTYDDATGRIEMPAMLRSNYTWMQGHGIYLMGSFLNWGSGNGKLLINELDDGDVMFMWLGADVEESHWRDLFGIANSHELNSVPVSTPG